ncbi:MAG TPA: hypothetical protein PK514_12700 [Spirochaetota bacterium]|nr:hypothetical protein [Spirochaetota bacterium]
MANDKQITKELALGSRFLPEEIANIDGGSEVYSLEDEFGKTRKNKNWLVFLIVFLFVAVIVSLTVFVTWYSREKDKKIDVSIQDFEDLRLKEALNSARLMENNLQIRRNILYVVLIEMKNKILEVNNRYLAKENAVLDRNIGVSATREKIAELRKAETAEVDAIKLQYSAKVEQEKKVINEIEREKIAMERELTRESKKIGRVGDDDRVYAVKMKNLSDSHSSGISALNDYYDRYTKYIVLKYNPLITSGEVKLSMDKYSKGYQAKILREYDEIFSRENIWSRKGYDDLRGRIGEQDMLLQRMMGTNYQNSVPPLLMSIDNLSSLIVNDYENLWFGLVVKIRTKNSEIEDYRSALDAVLKEKPESGYIISAANPAKISIHINRLITVREGDTGQVFRADDQYIGKIEFFKTPEGMRAKVISLAGNNNMKPFDRILIKIK